MKARVSNFGLLHSPTVMGGLVPLEPFDIIREHLGSCNCGLEDATREEHASSCPTQYALISVNGLEVTVYRPNIQVLEEIA